MTPKTFPEQNMKFVHEDCADLPAFVGAGQVISAWEITDEELEVLQRTKTVYLSVWGQGTPPVALYAQYPFTDQSEYPEILETDE
jgi:hypothetical protein